MLRIPRESGNSLVFRCFRCGLSGPIDDDGKRVQHVQVHVSACPSGPGHDSETRLRLLSGDHLELQLVDGSVWLEIRRRQGKRETESKPG